MGGRTETRRNRNLATNPAASVHLDGSTDVVILLGDTYLDKPDAAVAVRLSQASTEKYGYTPRPEEYEVSGVQVFHPCVVFAWKEFPKDVTRWEFPNDA